MLLLSLIFFLVLVLPLLEYCPMFSFSSFFHLFFFFSSTTSHRRRLCFVCRCLFAFNNHTIRLGYRRSVHCRQLVPKVIDTCSTGFVHSSVWVSLHCHYRDFYVIILRPLARLDLCCLCTAATASCCLAQPATSQSLYRRYFDAFAH